MDRMETLTFMEPCVNSQMDVRVCSNSPGLLPSPHFKKKKCNSGMVVHKIVRLKVASNLRPRLGISRSVHDRTLPLLSFRYFWLIQVPRVVKLVFNWCLSSCKHA